MENYQGKLVMEKIYDLKKIPCIDCLLVPMCKNKTSMHLLSECELFISYTIDNMGDMTFDNYFKYLVEQKKIFEVHNE